MLRRSSLVECVSVLPGNRCLQNVEFCFLRQYVQPCLLKNPKYTFYTIKSLLKLAYKRNYTPIQWYRGFYVSVYLLRSSGTAGSMFPCIYSDPVVPRVLCFRVFTPIQWYRRFYVSVYLLRSSGTAGYMCPCIYSDPVVPRVLCFRVFTPIQWYRGFYVSVYLH